MARSAGLINLLLMDPVSLLPARPLPEHIQSLFPNRFTLTDEMGWVPEGWEVGTIGSIAKAIGGYAFKSKDFQDNSVPVIKIKNIVGDGTVSLDDIQYVGREIASKAEKFELKDGELVMAMTGATVGKIGLIVNNEERSLLNQRVATISGKDIDQLNSYLFCFYRYRPNFEQIVGMAGGSAQPNISTTGIESVRCIIPSKVLLLEYAKLNEGDFLKWVENYRSSKSLSKLRDTLLPKLISGELRIPEAEEHVKEAVG